MDQAISNLVPTKSKQPQSQDTKHKSKLKKPHGPWDQEPTQTGDNQRQPGQSPLANPCVKTKTRRTQKYAKKSKMRSSASERRRSATAALRTLPSAQQRPAATHPYGELHKYVELLRIPTLSIAAGPDRSTLGKVLSAPPFQSCCTWSAFRPDRLIELSHSGAPLLKTSPDRECCTIP